MIVSLIFTSNRRIHFIHQFKSFLLIPLSLCLLFTILLSSSSRHCSCSSHVRFNSFLSDAPINKTVQLMNEESLFLSLWCSSVGVRMSLDVLWRQANEEDLSICRFNQSILVACFLSVFLVDFLACVHWWHNFTLTVALNKYNPVYICNRKQTTLVALSFSTSRNTRSENDVH